MWARTLSNRLMIAGPFVLVMAIAINGHGGAPYDDRSVFGPENHRRILRYVEPVRVSDILSAEGENQNEQDFQKALKVWNEVADRGEEASISPVDFEVPSQDTMLGDIREAKLTMLFFVTERIQKEGQEGRWDEAARHLVQGLRIANAGKYTEFSSVHQFGQQQARYAKSLRMIIDRISPSTREYAVRELSKLDVAEGRLQSIASNMRKLHYAALVRRGEPATGIELSEGYGALASLIDTGSEDSLRKLKAASMTEGGPLEMASIGTVARMAIKTENLYREELKDVLTALQSVK